MSLILVLPLPGLSGGRPVFPERVHRHCQVRDLLVHGSRPAGAVLHLLLYLVLLHLTVPLDRSPRWHAHATVERASTRTCACSLQPPRLPSPLLSLWPQNGDSCGMLWVR